MTDQKKLTRSTSDRVIAGVCGGLGAYTGIDPVLFRILFVLVTVWGGSGVLIYIILWVVIPDAGSDGMIAEHPAQPKRMNAAALVGIILILFGTFHLLRELFPWTWLRWDTVWPVFLVMLGLAIILKKH